MFFVNNFFWSNFPQKISLYFKSALKFSSFEPQIVQFQAKYFLVLQRRHLKTNICSLANYSLSDKKKTFSNFLLEIMYASNLK